MQKWLQKITNLTAKSQGSQNLVVERKINLPSTRQSPFLGAPQPSGLPNASVIYGVAASALFIMALFFVFGGHWFTGLLVALPALALFGFAMHFLRH